MFDKKAYAERRKKGLRGQGDPEKSVFKPELGSYYRFGGAVNRKQYRRKIRDGKFTTKHVNPQRTTEESQAIRDRVYHKEVGEQERVAKKRGW